jgi:methylenetetrahydrofolate reductase (NADPH)
MQRRETLFSSKSFRRKKGIQELYDNIDPLMEFKPPFIDVTTRENLFIDKGNGLLIKINTRMRPEP